MIFGFARTLVAMDEGPCWSLFTSSGCHGELLDFCHFFGHFSCHVCVSRVYTPMKIHKKSNGLEVDSAEQAMRFQLGVDRSCSQQNFTELVWKFWATFTRRRHFCTNIGND